MKPTTASAQLRAVSRIFKDGHAWVRRFWAKTSRRGKHGCEPNDDRATCFCLQGVLDHVGGTRQDGMGDSDAASFLRLAIRECGFSTDLAPSIFHFNDQKKRTIEEVRQVVRKAIHLAVEAGY